MSYDSNFTPLFLKLLGKLDKPVRDRVLTAVAEVVKDPRRGSQLVFSRQVCYKWKVGDYRMIYRIDARRKAVTFIIVDHRSRIYKHHRL